MNTIELSNTTHTEVDVMNTDINETFQEKQNVEQETRAPARKFKKQRGASLLDFIFWMGLAAIVIAGIAAMASSGKGKLKINSTLTDVSEMRAAVDAWAGPGFLKSVPKAMATVKRPGVTSTNTAVRTPLHRTRLIPLTSIFKSPTLNKTT